jgi:chemotaxis protein methyltransferase CheR
VHARDCEHLLTDVLPQLGLRVEGYRRVRSIVRKRLGRRLRELNLADGSAYRAYLAAHPAEWAKLAGLCLIPVSRFYRDAEVFDYLTCDVFAEFARHARTTGAPSVRALSAGCASGEEPYSLAIAWALGPIRDLAPPPLDIVAIDVSPEMVARAKRGCYPRGSFKELPSAWSAAALETDPRGDSCIRPELRERITFIQRDLRDGCLPGPFDLALCRNSAFTYFDTPTQRSFALELSRSLRPGGVLGIGRKESLPSAEHDLVPRDARLRIFEKQAGVSF